jgi:CheY-like chemotaxis protein
MKTILVAEDDRNQCALYAEELREDGYQVVCAKNGREALQYARECHPDLVVLDINMAGMDGLEAMSLLLEEQPHLPVIINTAYCSYKDNFMSWAADAYVCKSSDLSELKSRIKESLDEKAPAQA